MTTTTPRNWPSREEWAAEPYYSDYDEDLYDRLRWKASELATPAEVAAAVASLKTEWLRLGGELRKANAAAAHLIQQPKERNSDYYDRWKAMSAGEQELAAEAETIAWRRRDLNRVVKALEADEVPGHLEPPAALAVIQDRRAAAISAEHDERVRRYHEKRQSDEGWQAELARRAAYEEWLGRPAYRVAGEA